MKEYRFIQVDVFTDRAFGGNPLAVFPEAEGLDHKGDAAPGPGDEPLGDGFCAPAPDAGGRLQGAHLYLWDEVTDEERDPDSF